MAFCAEGFGKSPARRPCRGGEIPHSWGIIRGHSWGTMKGHSWGMNDTHSWGVPAIHSRGLQVLYELR